MNICKKYILLLIICLTSFVEAQKTPTYILEKGEVVFNFDIRDYQKATKDKTSQILDFQDLDIYSVSVSGQFNNWSKNGWEMKKIGPYTYQLRKNIRHFKDAFSWEFKFIINNQYWAEPSKDFNNIIESEESTWRHKSYNLKMYAAKVDDEGNASFFLKGYEHARKVILSGTFNLWNEEAFRMQKVSDGWKLTLRLRPDTYEYKFIVDGEWYHDPTNSEKVRNEYHTYNSILTIKKEVTFRLKGFENASKIVLAGDFNSWKADETLMKKGKDAWYCTVLLKGGKHHYKFIVDGKWITDPNNTVKERDSYGNINSVKMVD